MITALQRVGYRGNTSHIIKAIYDKPTANIIVNCEKLRTFPLRSETRQGCPFFISSIQHSFGSPSFGSQKRKRKGIQFGKEVKLSLFADEILYTEDPTDATRKL